MIKYDLNDLIVNKSSNSKPTTTTNCICHRMARLFGDMLKKNENEESVEQESFDSCQQTKNDSNELKHIYKELKLLRKFQYDLTSKFNIILNKLDNNNNNISNNSSTTTKVASSQESASSHMNNSSTSVAKSSSIHLTGAKKRKFNNSYQNLNHHQQQQNRYQDDETENNEFDAERSPVRSASVSSATSTTDSTTSNSNISNELLNSNKLDQESSDLLFIKNEEENNDQDLEGEHELDDLVQSFDNAPKNEGDFEEDTEVVDEDIEQVDYMMPNYYQQQLQRSFQMHQNRAFMPTTSKHSGAFGYSPLAPPAHLPHAHRPIPLLNSQTKYSSQNRMISPQAFDHATNPQQQQQNNKLPILNKITSPVSSENIKQELKPNQSNASFDIDINELFKGNGPKYLQLESYKNFKPPIVVLNDKYYVDDTMAALSYSKSKSRRNFAAHLTKLVFTPRERLESNCNGRFGKKALDSARLLAIRNTIFKYYPCKQSTLFVNGDKITSGDHDENSVWVRDCIPAIDESNRVLKKQLVAWYKKNNPNKLIRTGGGVGSNGSGHSGYGGAPNNSGYSSQGNGNPNLDETEFEELDEHD